MAKLSNIVLLCLTVVTMSLCSYDNVVKQYDVKPLSDIDDDAVTPRTDFDDGLGCYYPTDCYDVKECGGKKSRVYRVFPFGVGDGFLVYCDMATSDGGWLVFQRRQDGLTDFYRNWNDYSQGFGNLLGEHWLGLEKIHLLTSQKRYELRVDLQNYDKQTFYARYNRFIISNESQYYRLLLGSYTGTAAYTDDVCGDSLDHHNGFNFSTFDKDNDNSVSTHCAKEREGAWWYNSCVHSNLNGLYFSVERKTESDASSPFWYHIGNNNKPLQFTEMKLRPFV